MKLIKSIFSNYFWFILVFYASYIVSIHLCYAGISVNPGVIEAVAPNGRRGTQKITVVDTGKHPVEVNVVIGGGEKNGILPQSWFSLEPMSFNLNPGEKKEVQCRFTPPKDVTGELSTRLYVSGKEIGENASPIGLRFNMAVYLLIQGTIKMAAEIDKVEVKYNIKENTIEGSICLNNKSNVHIRPIITAVVKNLDGEILGNYKVPFGQPVKKRRKGLFPIEDKIVLKPGIYKIDIIVDYGKYYGQKGMVATKEAEFEVKPAEEEQGAKNEEREPGYNFSSRRSR